MQVNSFAIAIGSLTLLNLRFRQNEGSRITLLIGNETIDAIHFGCINESTLDTSGHAARREQQVATTNEVLSTRLVEDDARIDARCHTERHSCREVGLDDTCHDLCRRSLRSDDHMDTHGTSLLGNTCDGKLHFLTCCHDEVTILVDDGNDVGQVAVVGALATTDGC